MEAQLAWRPVKKEDGDSAAVDSRLLVAERAPAAPAAGPMPSDDDELIDTDERQLRRAL